MIAKLFQGTKTKYVSEDEESEEVNDTDVELPCEAGGAANSKRYQTFFDSWIMNKLREWNYTLRAAHPSLTG